MPEDDRPKVSAAEIEALYWEVGGLKSGRRDLIVNAIAVVGSVVVGTLLGWWLTTS